MSMKIEAYCACGGAIRGSVKTSDAKAAEKAVEIFRQVHTMNGCRPCDAKVSRKARQHGDNDATS